MEQNIDQQKKALRKKIKTAFAQMEETERLMKSTIILEKLSKTKAFQKAQNIMLFWSMKDEIFTHDFVVEWSSKKNIFLPAINGNEIEIRRFDGIQKLKGGDKYGIPEPIAGLKAKADDIELIVVPGVAFDKNNNRLGRGKAFYDKLLKNTSAHKTGICFDFQYFEQIPIGAYDIKMNEVVL